MALQGPLALTLCSGRKNACFARSLCGASPVLREVNRKIYDAFPEENLLHSGHGEDSTIGSEKRENRNVTATGVRWEAAGPADPPARSSATEPRSATLPFVMDHDRMIVELELSCADGTARKARAWVDTGQVGLGLTEAVAKDLALARGAATPRLRLGGMTLDTEGSEVRVGEGARVNPGVPAEVLRSRKRGTVCDPGDKEEYRKNC